MPVDRGILILTAEAGGGHRSVGQALSQALSRSLPEYGLTTINAYEEFLEFPLSLINGAHRQIVRHSPTLWRLLYESTSGARRFSAMEGLTRPLTRDKVENLFDRTEPAAVISVIPLVNELAGEVARKRGIPYVVVVTDMARIHPAWLSRDATLFCVPTAFAREELVSLGVPPAKIVHTGLPTRAAFFGDDRDRSSLRRKLGVAERSFAVLMMGGGEGVGVNRRVIHQLATARGVELYVFTGRNARLRKRIDRDYGESVRTLGFVENMDEWFKAADLLITKSGPSTLVEAAASGLPTLFVGALPGQEQSIIDNLLAGSSVGRELLCEVADISRRVTDLAGSEDERERLAKSIASFAEPGAATAVCDCLITLITEDDREHACV